MTSTTSGPGVGAGRPEPFLPDYGGACLTSVVASVVPGEDLVRPAWVPRVLAHASQVVLLVLDGLGWNQLQQRRAWLPNLAGGDGGPVTSVVPSTTATALTSLTTGLPPAEHGVVGYRVSFDHQVLNVLRWTLGGTDARRRVRPGLFQPHRPLAQVPVDSLAVVTRGEFATTGFTAAHLGRVPILGWSTPAGLAVQVGRALAEGKELVYAYYDGIDRAAHVHGLGALYDAELRAVDRMVGDVLEVLPPGAALAVTADHGQVDVGPRVLVLGRDVMDGVERMSGEGRFRWLHARPGAAGDLAAAAEVACGEVAWVRTLEQIVDDGWLGGKLEGPVRDRLGDVAVVPFEPVAFLDPADTGEGRLMARHGSLTTDEMLVPLLGWSPGA